MKTMLYPIYWVARSSLFEKLKLKFFDIFIPFIQPFLLFENQIHSTIRMKKMNEKWELVEIDGMEIPLLFVFIISSVNIIHIIIIVIRIIVVCTR